MKRPLSLAVIITIILAAATTADAKKYDTVSPTLDIKTVVIDTVATRQAINDHDAARKHEVNVYKRLINGLKDLSGKWGQDGLTPKEMQTLDSLLNFGPVESSSNYNKFVKDRQKGKASKELASYAGSFGTYIEGRLDYWMSRFYNPVSGPRVSKTRVVNNPFYLPAIINKPAMMDSTDYDSQVGSWTWIDSEKWTKREETYPKPFSYREYVSHPDLRVIGSLVFDTKGKLVAVKRMPRTGRQLRQNDGLLYQQMIDTLMRRDYVNNRDNILNEEDPVNPVLRARLGIDNNPELAAEPNKRVQSWINQLTREHKSELARVYKVERVDNVKFALTMLDENGRGSYKVIVTAENLGPYDVAYHVVDMEPAGDINVDLAYQAPSTIAPEQPFYDIPEEPATVAGGEDALNAALLNAIKLPSGALTDGLDHPVTIALEIDKNGKKKNVWIIRSSGELLDAVASGAVNSIREFKPGKVDLHAVNSMRYITLVFNQNGVTVK